MAKKRTKKQKARAVYHYAYPAGRSFLGLEADNQSQSEKKQTNSITEVERLYLYDPKLTRQDLTKTFIITFIMLGLEIGLYLLNTK